MSRLLKNKRAEREFWAADTWPSYIIFGIIINIVFILFLLGLNSIAEAETGISGNLEEFTISSGFLFSKDCFLYNPDNEAARAYKLDFNKFNANNLNNCVQSRQAFRSTLKFDEGESSIKTINWKEDKEVKRRESPKQVVVFKDNKLIKAKLIIELQ